ncbi:hypothetical protein [Butyrivibrio sp. WCD3002]|uniref:hypothetical protein n=1 Tax=Butyrivibrio sp. WCD3002 TaxID=1280676 RepID=UPI0003F54D62|nr:hypothetical protein [Butyrivibrio sp. WCD3002]
MKNIIKKEHQKIIDTVVYNGRYTDADEFRRKVLSVVCTFVIVACALAIGSMLI